MPRYTQARFSPTCPKCYAPTKVVAVFEGANIYDVIRRRHCPECGHRFYTGQYTEEIIPDDLELSFPNKSSLSEHNIYQVSVIPKK